MDFGRGRPILLLIVAPSKHDRLKRLEQLVDERSEQLDLVRGELRRSAGIDELTGLSNFSRFLECLRLEWRRALRNRSALSVIRIGVNHFKAYNERLGPRTGDDCLVQLARLFVPIARRPGDLIARYVAAEFVMVLSETTEAGALHVADRLKQVVTDAAIPHPASPLADLVTVCLGIATAEPSLDFAWEDLELLAAAGKALVLARQTGRDTVALSIAGCAPAPVDE